MKFVSAAVLLLALVPSAYLAWTFRDMPQFGEGHDDALLFASAKSLASGNGYRIPSLPGEPFQTKYPPLYPVLLTTVWQQDTSFPANLSRAMALAWAPLPCLGMLCVFLYRRWGVSLVLASILAAAVTLNPYTTLFALSLRTELLFSCFLIAALLALDRRPALAGMLAGCAYMTRTAGIALVVGAIVILLWRREHRKCLLFVVTAAPGALAWTLWVRAHKLVTDDPHLLYYLDYVRFGVSNQSLGNIHLFLWTNVWAMLEGAGALLLVQPGSSMASRAVQIVIAAIMIAGVVRSAKIRELQPYLAFAVLYALILLFWHFPPGARFLYPIFPLFLYGGYAEASRLITLAKRSSQPGAVVAVVSVLACFLVWNAWSQYQFVAVTLPENFTVHRERLAASKESFRWMKSNISPDAAILAPNDGQLHLYTGLHARNIITPPAFFYENRKDKVVAMQHRLVDFAITKNLRYIYIDRRFRYYLDDAEQIEAFDHVQRDPRVRIAYASGPVVICEVATERPISP